MENPLLTDQQIENGLDWTSRSTNARAMTPHAVRAFYEEQITRDRALIQTLMDKADSVIKRWDFPKWKWDQHTGGFIRELQVAVEAAKEQGLIPTEE